MLEHFQRSVSGNNRAFDHPAGNMFLDPRAHVGGRKYRPYAFHGRHRHARAGDTERDVRFPRIVEASRHCDADIVRGSRINPAEIALFEIDAFPRRVDSRADGNAID